LEWGEAGDFKGGMQTDHGKYLANRCQGYVTPLNSGTPTTFL